MNRTPVTSTNIRSVGYDPQMGTLEVEFTSGAVYQYFNVPERLHQGLMKAESKDEFFIEDRKCNFDVEIGVDMLLDCERNGTETFVLWSGDSDFADPLERLLKAGKKVVLFATARRVAKELSALRNGGLIIFDIQKIRDFIYWNREIQSKGDS